MRFTPTGRRLHTEARLNITPMIDVVFLLLIFFLATTTILDPEAFLSQLLRTNDESAAASHLEDQIIRVDRIGGEMLYVVGEQQLRTQAELTAVIRSLPKKPGVYIATTDRVTVEFATAAMQAAEDAGFETVTYVPAE
jgi:biopolymer transport protein ExbD